MRKHQRATFERMAEGLGLARRVAAFACISANIGKLPPFDGALSVACCERQKLGGLLTLVLKKPPHFKLQTTRTKGLGRPHHAGAPHRPQGFASDP